MANRDLIVIGVSAGGVEALQALCATLPKDLNAAIIVVMHLSPASGGLLPNIMRRAGCASATHARDGEQIEKGKIYIAPPDFHVIVDGNRLRVIRGPRENHHRPAIDPTFRSAAVAFGRRVIVVVLTGLLDDGTSGLMVIKAHGGAAVVQDPRTALFPAMPQSALEGVPEARVVTVENLGSTLAELVEEDIETEMTPEVRAEDAARDSAETRISELDMSEIDKESRSGEPSPYGCPECGGVLWEINQERLLRFRCRVGHAYTAAHLRAEQRHAVETALWSALRALEESASLYTRMADRARASNHGETTRVYEERASSAAENSRTLRDFLIQMTTPEAEISEAIDMAG